MKESSFTVSLVPHTSRVSPNRETSFLNTPIGFLDRYWTGERAARARGLFVNASLRNSGAPTSGLRPAGLRFIGASAVAHIAVVLLALGCFANTARSQGTVIAHPAYIIGSVNFGNGPGEIRTRLSADRTAVFSGDTVLPAPPLHFDATKHVTASVPPSPSFPYNLTVEGAPSGGAPGYVYEFGLDLYAGQQYWPRKQTSPEMRAGVTETVNFNECPGMLDVRFVNRPGGDPVAVSHATIQVFDTGSASIHALVWGAAGTSCKVLVHSGTPLHLVAAYSVGTDPMLDLISHFAEIDAIPALDCDVVRPLEIVVPAALALGHITGTVDMVGIDEIPHDGIGSSRNTIMVADGAPGGDDFAQFGRYTFLNHTLDHILDPPSSEFVLPNLLASEDFSPTFGTVRYRVYGRMQFGTGHARNCFRTPSLYGASRPLVPRGGSVGLGDMFVMRPGYVNGQIVLQGRPEVGGFRSPLRHVRTASDMGEEAWLTRYYSSVEARGTELVAAGATESTYEGVGVTEIDGAFAGDSYRGNYQLVLAGLKSQPSVWDLSRFNLYFDSTGSGDPYILGKLLITDRLASPTTILPSADPSVGVNRDLRLCFGSVTVNFEVPPGITFLRPAVSVSGHYSGLNDLGLPVDYDVETGEGRELGDGVRLGFRGETTGQTGIVRMALPQGTYTFTPSIQVVAADGSISTLTLPIITHTVLCRGDCESNPNLQVNFMAPPMCASSPSVHIQGTVASSTDVSQISWDRGDNLTHVICDNCGPNPGFAFDLPVNGPCQDQTVTVTARDMAGRMSYCTITIPADRIAPTIQCPTNVLVTCSGPQGAPANYPAPVVTDNCDPNPTVICIPPAGSWFQLGDTLVKCVATDRCGNTNECSFTVTVTTNCPPPEPCIDIHCSTNIVRYVCGSNCVSVDYFVWAENHCSANDVWVTTYPPSGTCFPLGVHTVDAWAFGSGQTNHCSFTVTVLPDPNCPSNPPPCIDIHCPTNLTAYACGSNCVSVPFTVWATDRCSSNQVSVVTDYPSGYCFPLGITWVNATATGSGQSAQCSFPVTVLPDANCTNGCPNPYLRIIPTVTVEWNCGILQSAPEVTGPYTDVPGATSPYTTQTTGLQRFFRTR